MSAPVPSGIGAFHYIISRGLAFVEGVKIEDGLVYALLSHESQLDFYYHCRNYLFFHDLSTINGLKDPSKLVCKK